MQLACRGRDQKEIVIIDPQQYNTLADMVSGDVLVRERAVENTDAFARTWLDSFRDVYKYLGVPIPSHVVSNRAQTLQMNADALRRISSERLGWLSFHLNRFAFDQIFYGGVAVIEKPDGDFHFRIALQSRIAPAGSPDPYLRLLERLLRDKAGSISLSLRPIPPTTPPSVYARSNHLEVRLLP